MDAGAVIAGGLLTTTKVVENYPGFSKGIDGLKLTDEFRAQSLRYGTDIRSETAQTVERQVDGTFLVTTKEQSYHARTLLIATGSTPKRLDVPGYDRFWQKGISTCAVCDGSLPVFRKQPLAVVGGGDSACEEALHLAQTASLVYMIHRRDALRASPIMRDRVLSHPTIRLIWDSEITAVEGKDHVEHVAVRNVKTGEVTSLPVRGLFVAIGHLPNTAFLGSLVECDEVGYIRTGRDMATTAKGVWAAGDVQDPLYRQAITAAGSGCVAALEIERWLAIHPFDNAASTVGEKTGAASAS